VFQPSVPAVSVTELSALLATDPTTPLIDVREAHEFADAHVPGAVLLPMSGITGRLDEIPRDRTVYVVCAVGGRSGQVVAWLTQQGYDAVNIEGGTQAWLLAGLPVE
jgi:rhodanese-related sulfurtransferase